MKAAYIFPEIMIYIKLSQSPKTLAIALTLAGAYWNIPLPNADSLAQAQSSIADVSTSTPTHQNSAQLKGLSAQEESTQIKNSADRSTENQRFGTALTPKW
jgi:aryl-alcohol dehydrogenase-like predicted oxidoreductase